jgi:chemotaxis protein MotB
MRSQMDKLAPVLLKLAEKHDVVVEGHTDNVPIYTKQFAYNWELSTARATSVVKDLLDKKFPPKHLAAVGYGEFHPIVPNDNEVNRKKNRRVVFFIKNNPYPDAPAAGPPAPVKKEGAEGVQAEAAPAEPAQPAAAPETPAAEGEVPAAGEQPAEEGGQ